MVSTGSRTPTKCTRGTWPSTSPPLQRTSCWPVKPTLHQAQQTGAQVKAALAERFALTNVTIELEESPAAAPTPVPGTATC